MTKINIKALVERLKPLPSSTKNSVAFINQLRAPSIISPRLDIVSNPVLATKVDQNRALNGKNVLTGSKRLPEVNLNSSREGLYMKLPDIRSSREMISPIISPPGKKKLVIPSDKINFVKQSNTAHKAFLPSDVRSMSETNNMFRTELKVTPAKGKNITVQINRYNKNSVTSPR